MVAGETLALEPDEPVVPSDRTVYLPTGAERDTDLLVREEPLEIRVNGVPIAVLMRTPGADQDLVRGFLLTERIVPTRASIASVRPCRTVASAESEGNVMLARVESEFDPARFRRNLYTTSSCGICGKASIEQALAVAPPLPPGPPLGLDWLRGLVPAMRRAQPVFDLTGGLHAAAAFDVGGRLLAVREDVGRHNAVDKVIGALEEGSAAALTVSGRLSFEIVQKALAARIGTLVAVSAPSALAVELARRSGMTLVAFARGERLVVYSDPGERVRSGPEGALGGGSIP